MDLLTKMRFISTGSILIEYYSYRYLVLLCLMVWSAAWFYYFLFYVIEHYVDPTFRFAGFLSFMRYWLKQRSNRSLP